MIDLTAIDQSVFDRANSDTAEDVPCILLRAGDYRQKLTIAEACDLFARLGGLLAGSFESAKTSLRARGLTTAREVPAPTRPRSPLDDDSNPADRRTDAKPDADPYAEIVPQLPRRPGRQLGSNNGDARADRRPGGRSPLARFIRERRRELGLSQRDLSIKSQLSNQTIWAIENDLARPSDTTMRLLAAALSVEVKTLSRHERGLQKGQTHAA